MKKNTEKQMAYTTIVITLVATIVFLIKLYLLAHK